MTDAPTTRACRKCGESFPATLDYFRRRTRGKKYGLMPRCKKCMSQRNPLLRQVPATRICKTCGEEKPFTTEYFPKRKFKGTVGLRPYCITCESVRKKKSYALKREANLAASRAYRESETGKRNVAEYRETHREKAAEAARLWKMNNPDRAQTNAHNRRARQRDLPNTLTSQDWTRCLEYFHYTCAVCGSQLRDLFGTHAVAADHWIPLDAPDCPGTIPANIIPLCHSKKGGRGGCNSTKNRLMPADWLARHYKPAQVKAILKRVNDYFEWTKRQEQSA